MLVDTSANSAARRPELGQYVRDEPFTALAIAAAAGFIVGGGLNSRSGRAMLTMVGRLALQSAATSLLAGMVAGILENARPNSDQPAPLKP